MRMKSIQTKIMLLVVTALLVCSTLIGGIGIMRFQKTINAETVELLNWTAEEKAQELNGIMGKIEQSVEIMSAYTISNLKSVEAIESDIVYLEGFSREVAELGYSIMNETDGAVSVYLRFAPELAGNMAGFFWVRNSETGNLEEYPVTDFSKHEKDDISNVGWYYVPVANRDKTWMEPYKSGYSDEQVVSYVVPLYKDNTLIGVAGMDISFDYMIEQIKSIHFSKTGHAFITDHELNIVFSDHYEKGASVSVYSEELKNASMEDITSMEHVYSIELEGIKRKIAFSALQNNMCLAVIVPAAELNEGRDSLTIQVISSASVVLLIFTFISWFVAKSIVRPLRQLTAVAKEVAEGNLEVELESKSKDEVGLLTDSLRETVFQLKLRIDYINNLAYIDKLTGIKNNTAYLHEVSMTKVAIDKDEADFAVFVVDVNGLKRINDAYGHVAGNELLIAAAKAISNAFGSKHSYRIGGDEFAVILKHGTKEQYEERIKEFEKSLKRRVGTVKVAAAIGYAIYDKNEDIGYDAVFKRADEMMYAKKEAMKEQGENSVYYP